MIHDTVSQEIKLVESVLSSLEMCKRNGSYNNDAMCQVPTLRDLAREYLYSLYRQNNANNDIELGPQLQILDCADTAYHCSPESGPVEHRGLV